MHGVEQPPQYHPEGDVWVHTMLLLEKLPARSARARWRGARCCTMWASRRPSGSRRTAFASMGMSRSGVRMAEEICRRLHFSNEDTEQIAALVANHMRFGDVERMKESTLKRFMRLPKFDEHMELHRMDCLSSHGGLSLYNFVRERLEHTPEEEMRPAPLIKGGDLIAIGYGPGPRFKEILSAVEDAQLEGSLHTREDAMRFVLSNFPRA